MVGPILKESIIFIVFCHIFVSGKDILELFRPNPSLPEELNEWLATVQKYKSDFRLIREIAAANNKEKRSSDIQYDDDEEDTFEEQAFDRFSMKNSQDLDEQPKNDIYPYMYKNKPADSFDSNSFISREDNDNLNSPLRLRRDLNLFEDQNSIKVQPKSKSGEIKRSDSKYPDRYINSKKEFSEGDKLNLKSKDNSKVDDGVKKREIQIDVRNNGKLIKQITETGKNPRPILLNIQTQGKENNLEKLARNLQALNKNGQNTHNKVENNFKNSNIKSNNIKASNVQNNIVKDNKKTVHINLDGLPKEKEYSQVRSVKTEPMQLDKKESLTNFNNLFSVNEHLNTDISLAHDATKELIYHITFPQYSAIPEYTYGYTPPIHDVSNIEPDNKKTQKLQPSANIKNISNFNHNNLQDMSNFWTDSEKNRMRQGIESARNNENFKRFPPKGTVSQHMDQEKENDTGFEPAQRIELDQLIHDNVIEISDRVSDALKDFHSRNKKNMIEMNTVSNNIPNFEDLPQQNNRELEVVEGKRQDNFGLGKYDMNGRNFDESSAIYASPIDNGAPPNPNRFEKMHPVDMNSDGVAAISGDKLADGYPESVSCENEVSVVDSLNAGEQDPEVPLEDSLNEIPLPIEPNMACGLASVGLAQQGPVNTGDVEEFPDVEVDRTGADDVGVDSAGMEADTGISECPHKNIHCHEVHKYITKTETITEVDEYPNEEENERENNGCNEPYGQPPQRHRDVKVIAAPFRRGSDHRKAYKSPDSDQLVFVRNRPRYGLTNNKKFSDKNPRFGYGDNGDNGNIDYRKEVKEPYYGFNQYDRKIGKKRANHNRLFAALPSVNLMMNKRSILDDPRSKFNSRMNNFETLLSNNHGNYLNADNEKSYYGKPKSQSDFIPAFIGRKLHSVEYAYDAYLDAPGEDSFDEISTELQEAALENGEQAELIHKNSVEGDYGDEEDSITEKNKKKVSSITKKTKNEFANPRTTTETDYDDDYVEDYDNKDNRNEDTAILTTKGVAKRKQSSRVSERMQIAQRNREDDIEKNKGLSELKDTNINNFAHHLHRKYNPFQKIARKHVRSVNKKGNKVGVKDEKSSKSNAKRNPKRNIPRKRHKRNRITNARFVDGNSDFQHWPNFVINDNENEETLKKRSLVMKKKYPRVGNNFPLASKDFFVRQQSQQRISNTKETPTENPTTKAETYRPLGIEKRLLPESENPSVATEKVVCGETVNLGAAADADNEDGDDLESGASKATVANACEENENFNRTAAELTTILPIIPESFQEVCENIANKTPCQSYETVDDIINGDLPERLVSDIFVRIEEFPKLKRRFNQGLTRTNKDTSFINLNETNTETKKLIKAMSNIVNKLEFTTTCQTLPHYLQAYLKVITKVKKENVLDKTKEMEDVEFDKGQNENNYIFESLNRGGMDNLDMKVKILKELLNKFNSLPDKCKTRAKPVKEYIENHIGLLNNMEYGGIRRPKPLINKPISNPKRTADIPWKDENTLVQEQLASLGLGSQHNFKPKFNLDELIQDKQYDKVTTSSGNQATAHPQNVNVNKRDLESVSPSKKYNKLLDAVRKVRLRREGERRLGEMYGKPRKESSDYSEFHGDVKNTDTKYISRANFESPLVYSL